MGMNIGTVTTSKMSFGPGILYLGAAGTTPTVDIGHIKEDGLEIEVQQELGDIMGGNPLQTIMRFVKAQNVFVRAPGGEWNMTNLAYALGTGVTSVSAGHEIMNFGGKPCTHEVAIQMQHRKCTAVHTLYANIWKATTETGGLSIAFGQEQHSFAMGWKALRATTNWAGAALANDSELMQLDMVTS
jgi:hypothetical protein